MINRIIALITFMSLIPLLIIIYLIILIDDGFPVFFKQERIGLNNKTFSLYKFRTMKKDMPDIPTHLLTNSGSFFTKTGIFFRKYSFDELPQLINIIKGDMNLIGPRPALHNQKDLIEMRNNYGIQNLKPGLTGWAQINGRNSITWEEKFDLDVWYVNNRSFWLDLKIIFITIKKVIISDGISAKNNVTMSKFRGSKNEDSL